MSDENNPIEDPAAAATEIKSRIDAVKGAVTDLKDTALTKASELKTAAVAKAEELKSAGAEKLNTAKAAATAKFNDAKSTFDAKRVEYTEKGKVHLANAKYKAGAIHSDSEAYVKENPTKAIVIALAAGFFIGLLLRGGKK